MHGWPAGEAELRVARCQAALLEVGFDCLMITDDRQFYYFVGYDGTIQRARPRFFFIPARGAPVVLVAPNLETIVRECSPFPDVRLYTTMGRLPLDEVVAILRELIGTSGRVGAELGREQRIGMSVLDFLRLRDAVPAYPCDDAADVLWCLRLVKTPFEQDALRRTLAIANQSVPQAFGSIRPGMTEIEIADLFAVTLRAHGAHRAGAAVVSGAGSYFRSMAPPRPRAVERGDMVWADVAASVDGYWCDFSRAATVGPATQTQRDHQRLVREITAAGVAAVRSGVRASEVATVCDRAMAARGLEFNSGALR